MLCSSGLKTECHHLIQSSLLTSLQLMLTQSPSKIPHFKAVTWPSGQKIRNHLFNIGTHVACKPVTYSGPRRLPGTSHTASLTLITTLERLHYQSRLVGEENKGREVRSCPKPASAVALAAQSVRRPKLVGSQVSLAGVDGLLVSARREP